MGHWGCAGPSTGCERYKGVHHSRCSPRDPLSGRQTDVRPDYSTRHGNVPGAGRDTLGMEKLLLAGGSWASFLRDGAFALGLEGKVEF